LNDADPAYFFYEYDLQIRFSKEQSTVFIDREFLRLKKLHADGDDAQRNTNVGAILVTRRSGIYNEKPRSTVGPRLLARNSRNPLAAADPMFESESIKLKERLRTTNLAPDQSILSIGSRYSLPAIEAVRTAITRGRSFNIHPEKARTPDDITRTPSITRDGSGLTSTLHAIQSLRRAGIRRNGRIPRANRTTMDEIVEWTRLVFPDLDDISVNQDPHTGKYLAQLSIGGSFVSDATLKLPLQSASDGTLKWLTLVTLLLSSGGVYSIEEPENFLHPKMQQFLVQLIRDNIVDRRRTSYFIFSTHSETLINYCDPSELVIFEYFDHATCCYRIDNPGRVLEEINRTGFGLGYYYANNSLPQNSGVRGGHDGEAVR
jgi:hypothetical protein